MAIFNGTNGNDNFSGTEKRDIVTFSGNAAGYEIRVIDGAVRVVDIDASDGDTGTDTLSHIDVLRFADRDFEMTNSGEFAVVAADVSNQGRPVVQGLPDGGYLVVWNSYEVGSYDSNIMAQRYDAAGNAIGGKALINTVVGGYQNTPSIALLADEGYVIVWQSARGDGGGGDGDGYGVFSQRFDAAGNAIGAETRVNTHIPDHQIAPVVTGLDGGGHVVAWTSYYQDGAISSVHAQRYDASGNVVGAETRINTFTAGYQFSPAIAALADGGHIVAWTSQSQDGNGLGVYVQRYDAAGNAVGGEMLVNTRTAGNQTLSSIIALDDGGFLITWHSPGDGDGTGVYAQRYDADGDAVGGQTRINATRLGEQSDAAATALADGGYVIVWQSSSAEGSNIFARRFDADGNLVGKEMRISTERWNYQEGPDVTAMTDGGYVITWLVQGPGTEVHSQRFDASGKPVNVQAVGLNGTADSDAMNGGAGMQSFQGLAGDDLISAGSGDDIVSGGLDNDILNGGSGNDALYGDAGLDVLAGGSGDDYLQGGEGDDTIDGGDGDDTLEGARGNDILIGGKGDDWLLDGGTEGDDIFRGGDGNDVMQDSLGRNTFSGGNGNDSIYGGYERDRLYGGQGNDLLEGGKRNDMLDGAAGDDRLDGEIGEDRLFGGNGDDLMIGGRGDDTMTGGNGADSFRFATELWRGNIDTITDFEVGVDVLLMENGKFVKLGATGALNADYFAANAAGVALDANDYLVYETDTGKLFYDQDGSGAALKQQIGLIGNLAALTAADFVVV